MTRGDVFHHFFPFGMFLFLFHFWRKALLIILLGWQFFSFNIFHILSHTFLASKVFVEITNDSVIGFSVYEMSHFSIPALKTLLLAGGGAVVDNFIKMHLSVVLFIFNTLGVFWMSWISMSIFIPMFGNFSAIITLHILPTSLSSY